MRANAQGRTIGLICRKGLGTSRADISGNGRRSCEPEFNSTGYEGEWSAFDPLPKLTQASDKDVRIIIGKERESYEPEFNFRIQRRETQAKNGFTL